MNNIKISKNIKWITVVLTLLNVSGFVFFAQDPQKAVVAAIVCLFVQVAIFSTITLPNFYFFVLKEKLAELDFINKAILKENQIRHQQTESTIGESQDSIRRAIKSELENLLSNHAMMVDSLNRQQDAIDKKLNRLMRERRQTWLELKQEYETTYKAITSQLTLEFTTLVQHLNQALKDFAVEQADTFASLSEHQEKGFKDLAKQQNERLDGLALQQTDGFASLAERQEKGLASLVERSESTLKAINSSQETLFSLLSETLTDQFKVLVDQFEGAAQELESLKEISNRGLDELRSSLEAASGASIAELKAMTESNREASERTLRTLGKALENLDNGLGSRVELAYERIDALLSLHNLLKIAKPLPIMHDWTVSPDYANALVKAVLDSRGGTIIDVGSGVSTIVLGYASRIAGKGRVISLEHSEDYHAKTVELIKSHGLTDYCEVRLCPLKEYKFEGEKWLWYDVSGIEFGHASVISVDGPPGLTQKFARYPALPILKETLTANTLVFLDDANRADEMEIAKRWENKFDLKAELVKSHKGYFVFTKSA